MSLVVKNTRDLISPDQFKLKLLCYADVGFGKTSFAAGSPNPLIAVADTGHMKGLLSAAYRGVNYVEPETYPEFELFCGDSIQTPNDTLVVDPLSTMCNRFIKDYALTTVTRKQGDTQKRSLGIAEMDDYQVIQELTRRLMSRLLDVNKHVVVTAHVKEYQPQVIDKFNSANNKSERLGGPELPGKLSNSICGMFDVVIRGVKQSALRDPKDATSRYERRIWITESMEKFIAKNRIALPNSKGQTKSLFPPEVEYNLETGSGTWQWFYERAKAGYTEIYESLQKKQ